MAICKVCGKEFMSSQKFRTYCSDECKSCNSRHRPEPKQKIKKSKLSVTDISLMAAELHMSYGEYVAKFGV